MKEKLEQIQQIFDDKISTADSLADIDALRVAYLGKKGELTSVLRGMGALSAEERPVIGQLANVVREHIESSISTKTKEIKAQETQKKLAAQAIDVTMPSGFERQGTLHPINVVSDEMKDLFIGMGYTVADGPEVEFDYYNFEALNIPDSHPARDTQDTFYIIDNMLLRSQTSSVQIRVMENAKPPIKIICPGKVYRADNVDATHSPIFHIFYHTNCVL